MRRPAAVAGSWYPASPERLRATVDTYLREAETAAGEGPSGDGALVGLICPHAGLVYSGPVAAHAYRLLADRTFDGIVLVGPSHYVPFEGVSIWPEGSFETPFGDVPIDAASASALIECCPVVRPLPSAHGREHSLEMQLPFVAALAPGTPIVPLVMGQQTRATAFALGDALAEVCAGRHTLLVASSDLSHFYDAAIATRMDAEVLEDIDDFSADSLMARLERRPDHACGGGPMVSVLRASRMLGAATSRVLRYADSGDVSGDKSSVVGYVAAAIWK